MKEYVVEVVVESFQLAQELVVQELANRLICQPRKSLREAALSLVNFPAFFHN